MQNHLIESLDMIKLFLWEIIDGYPHKLGATSPTDD
jgi:hypothetical protein